MSNRDFKIDLWNRIMELPIRHKHGDSQLSVRCPFCGDSRRSPRSTHFYIKINMKEDEPVLFNCFKCDMSGILTPAILRSIDISELSLTSGLLSYNKVASKNNRNSLGITNNNFNFKIPTPDPLDEGNLFKKKYFEDRLGITTTFEEMSELKIIFKLGEFLKINGVNNLTTSTHKAQELHNNYMGFVSAKNEFVNFRQVKESKYKRYEKYNVFDSLDNSRKFYTIPNSIDLLDTKKVTINIAEGSFDILGVYYHLYEKESRNMIYTAVGGAGFASVIKYFIQMGLVDNVDVNIYSDDDRDPAFYKKMVKELSPWVNDFNLFYNEKSKDFGVPKNKIKVIKKKL